MQPDNRINRLVSNHFDGDQIILMELFATDLSELNKNIKFSKKILKMGK